MPRGWLWVDGFTKFHVKGVIFKPGWPVLKQRGPPQHHISIYFPILPILWSGNITSDVQIVLHRLHLPKRLSWWRKWNEARPPPFGMDCFLFASPALVGSTSHSPAPSYHGPGRQQPGRVVWCRSSSPGPAPFPESKGLGACGSLKPGQQGSMSQGQPGHPRIEGNQQKTSAILGWLHQSTGILQGGPKVSRVMESTPWVDHICQHLRVKVWQISSQKPSPQCI